MHPDHIAAIAIVVLVIVGTSIAAAVEAIRKGTGE